MNIVLVQYDCKSCGEVVVSLSDDRHSSVCAKCKRTSFKERLPNMTRMLKDKEFAARKAELEALHGTIHGKRRWEKLDPDCYVPLYY